jgi:hypothetical protein
MTARFWALASIFLPTPNIHILRSPAVFCHIWFMASYRPVLSFPFWLTTTYYFSPQMPLDTTKVAVTHKCPMFKVTTGTTIGLPATVWAQTCWSGWALGLHSTPRSITCGRHLATNWTTAPMGRQGKNRRRETSVRQQNLCQPDGHATDKGESTIARKQLAHSVLL